MAPTNLKKSIILTVVMLMAFQFITAAVVPAERSQKSSAFYHPDSKPNSCFAFLAEKTEEGRSEEERDKLDSFELLDLSRIAFTLSIAHTPPAHTVWYEHRSVSRPLLFKINCNFLI
jgi:hypothetical protein